MAATIQNNTIRRAAATKNLRQGRKIKKTNRIKLIPGKSLEQIHTDAVRQLRQMGILV